jgi:hypothetical protein
MRPPILTRKEHRLNTHLQATLTEAEAVEMFGYMTKETRLKFTDEANIRKQWRLGRLGSLMKRLDREQFDKTKI